MNGTLLFALGSALSLAAQTTPTVKLEKMTELPIKSYTAAISPDSSLIADGNENSVGVWSLQDGRQVNKIAFPLVRDSSVDSSVGYYAEAFSPDARFLLVSFQHIFGLKRAELELYLVSLEDEKVRKLPVSWKNYCHQKPLHYVGDIEPYDCPTLHAAFSPDGKRILVNTFGYPKESAPSDAPDTFADESTEIDLDGKVLHKTDELFQWPLPKFWPKPQADPEAWRRPFAVAEHPTGAGNAGYRGDGVVVGIVQDATGCELLDLNAQKRIAFLDGCANDDSLRFDDRGAIVGTKGPQRGTPLNPSKTVKRWDAGSGKMLTNFPCAGCKATFTERNAEVFIAREQESPTRLEIWNASLDAVLFSTSAAGVYSYAASPDGSRLIESLPGDRVAIYKTGLTGGAIPVLQAVPTLVDVDDVPRSAVKIDPDAYAVVIGVEKYRQDGIPAVDFAARDAQTMASYLTGAMGFDPKNVVLLTDARASRTDFEKNLGSWLKNRVGPKSRVFVYYAGHGSPNPETGQGYLMPYEADPAYLEDTAYPLAKLYAALGKLPTQDVTVVLDACFSGQGGRSLIAKGTRPLVSVVQSKAEPNTVVLAAAGSNQVSASFPEARHGLLTYYLLAGLHGEADAKHDGKITADELYAYVRPAVERAAKLQNVEQTPTLSSSLTVQTPWIVLLPGK